MELVDNKKDTMPFGERVGHIAQACSMRIEKAVAQAFHEMEERVGLEPKSTREGLAAQSYEMINDYVIGTAILAATTKFGHTVEFEEECLAIVKDKFSRLRTLMKDSPRD